MGKSGSDNSVDVYGLVTTAAIEHWDRRRTPLRRQSRTGLTVVAAAGTSESGGGAIVLSALLLSATGFYLACTGMWAGWAPSPSVQLRARSIRIALTWAALVASILVLSLPLSSPLAMTTREWTSALALVGLLLTSGIGIAGITRYPRVVATLLALSGGYSLLALLGHLRALASPQGSAVGPGAALGFLLAGSMFVALIAAALLAWPLRSASDGRAI